MTPRTMSRRTAMFGLAGIFLADRAFAASQLRGAGSLVEVAKLRIAPHITRIICSGGSNGGLPLPFVSDPIVDAAFAQAHPAAAFVTANNRGFRLDDSAISVEAFGSVGDGIANDQPAIQAAIRYAEAVRARTVRFLSARYAVHSPPRTLDLGVNSSEGHPIVITGQIALRGRRVGGSTILYRNVDGGDFAHHWQVVGDKVWRGAGIFLQGLDQRPVHHAELPSVTLIDMVLDGGCDRTECYGYPARLSDGDGWDETHKGLWAQNDRVTGDWLVIRSKIIRFRGELFYQGGTGHGAFTGRKIVMGQTNADILNPCGSNLDIIDGLFYDGNSGWEGWGGRNGRLLRCRFERCRSLGGIQGGRADASRLYFTPRRFDSGVDPWLTLDVTIVDCGQVSVGNWVRGRMTLVDSFLYLSAGVFPTLHDVDLDVSAYADKRDLGTAVALSGSGQPGSEKLGRIRIRLAVSQTNNGRSAGHSYRQPVAWGGSLGPGIVFDVRTSGPIGPSRATFKAMDDAPIIVMHEGPG